MSGRYDLSSQLRPSDIVRAVVEGRIPESLDDVKETEGPSYPALFAAVVHSEGGRESGCILAYRIEQPDSPSEPESLMLERVFPIHAEFIVRISQPQNRGTVTSPPPTPAPDSLPDQTLALDIYKGPKRVLSLLTESEDKEDLSATLFVCRALRDIAIRDGLDTGDFPWLRPYKWNPEAWLSVKPPRDLRLTRRPMHTQLAAAHAGATKDDAADFLVLRNNWLATRPRAQLLASAEHTPLRIRVGTFNVNGKLPSQDLSAWISGHGGPDDDTKGSEGWDKLIPPLQELSPLSLGDSPSKTTSAEVTARDTSQDVPQKPTSSRIYSQPSVKNNDFEPDLLVLGFEELDLSAGALVVGSSTSREDSWTKAALAGLGDRGEAYDKLASKQLVGMLLLVFVKKELRERFSVVANSLGAGLMGIMGNKGAVSVRLTYRPTPSSTPIALTFVDAHLAAFDEALDRRNADFHDISRRLILGPCMEYVQTPQVGIFHSDALIWMVNLNYRIDLPSPDIRTILRTHPVHEASATLQKFDQLRCSIRDNKAFDGFEEHPISFLPTYRFSEGLAMDSLGYDLKRKPAWTDRVLHMSSDTTSLEQLTYTSHPHITFSDHRPVSANFVAQIPHLDAYTLDAKADELFSAVKDVDLEDSDDVPTITLSETVYQLGDVQYDAPLTRNMTVKNIGKIPAAFRFLPRETGSPTSPPWLSIEPMTAFILPGESCEVTFTIHVRKENAHVLNLKQERFTSTIILHTLLGKDHFVALWGDCLRTCFGTSFNSLTRLKKPIRDLDSEADLIAAEKAMHAPKEISSLVNWLLDNQIEKVDDLFLTPGDPALVAQIRECLDTGAAIPTLKSNPPTSEPDMKLVLGVGATLFSFLDSLPEPIIPTSLHPQCVQVPDREAAFVVLSSLPTASINAWVAITSCLHLYCIQTHEHQPGASGSEEGDIILSGPRGALTRAERIADIWTPILLRDDPESPALVSLLDKRRFLLFFIDPSI
ncbi:DNase I-like protein [Peniophora sp. CONT]|nr:DNase I-like protein [Peniophora sp. CONT]